MAKRLRWGIYPGAECIGTLQDPFTKEDIKIYAKSLEPKVSYKKRDGTTGDLITDKAREDWPDEGAYNLYTSNGRVFGEVVITSLEKDGWWITPDKYYLPLCRGKSGLFTQFYLGWKNGYPIPDVISYLWFVLKTDFKNRRGGDGFLC